MACVSNSFSAPATLRSSRKVWGSRRFGAEASGTSLTHTGIFMRARSYRLKIGRPRAEGSVTVRHFGREPEPMLFSHRTTARAVFLLLAVGVFAGTANAAAEVPEVTAFPVVGNVSYTDDFGDPRPQGSHEGNDIMSVVQQPTVALRCCA